MKEKEGLTFPLLMDPGSETIKRYGLLNEEQGSIPHPSTLVIDPEGVIRFLEIDVNYRLRPPAEDVLAALEALQSPQPPQTQQ